MHGRKRSRLVRAKGCNNLLRGDVPKVSTYPKSHSELLDVYLHCCCHGQDNHVCVYCSQNHLLVAHIDSILQVQNLSAVSLFMFARAKELKSRRRLHRASSPYVATTCFSVSRWVRCTAKKVNNCFVGIDPQKTVASFLKDWWRLLPFYGHPSRSYLWLRFQAAFSVLVPDHVSPTGMLQLTLDVG